MRITIQIDAELEGSEDADAARWDVVNSLERLLPYVFDNVIVTSNVVEIETD